MEFEHIIEPKGGSKISMDSSGKLIVPDNPIVPFIEGDGIGSDITPAMISVVDSAVEKSYGGKKKIEWMEIYCGEKSTMVYGEDNWLPPETLRALEIYLVGILSLIHI